MKRINYFFFALVLLFCQTISAQWLSTSGKNIVNDSGEEVLLRGMGLGGWMLMEGYMMQTADFANPQHQLKERIVELIGEEDTEVFFDAWLANHVTKADIDSLKSWGFNSVRLPMHYNLFTLSIQEEPVSGENTWLTKGFELTDQLIEWCKANEMYVILDLHAAPGGQGQDEAISDYDPSKPSLWESANNRIKTVDLWKRIADHYKDEPWVAGYDLLNEPNWNLSGNILLKNLYLDVTKAIREVDNQHIIFIEGNWFANDFTNLTPPWDDNLVYSPHKYWSVNDQASIQWVLDIREQHNVPLYLGESGENSNVWFRDAIRLLEDNNIGWAWWPMKKIESIAGPLSIIKTDSYQDLLEYWRGQGTKPSPEVAKNTLMNLADLARIGECRYQKDAIDAMFRQVYSDETVPFNIQDIPGIVYATDYDMGIIGQAYQDNEFANYQVTTGDFTSWNNGWAYRNDGVDIEVTEDNVNSNGFNVGWLNTDEWMQYSINVEKAAIYDIEMRVASNSDNAKCYFSIEGAPISIEKSIPNTGGWQSWQTVTIPNVVLSEEDKSFRFNISEGGFNLNSFKFVEKSGTTSLSTSFISATASDPSLVQLDINKPLQSPLPNSPANFSIFVNGSTIQISDISLANNNRTILFNLNHTLKASDVIKISYDGSSILAQDGVALSAFNQANVVNNIPSIHLIPGRIEAEDYFFQFGIQLENTTDTGGGQNIGFLDTGDYLDYNIEVPTTGTYQVSYRTAAESARGAIQLQIIEDDDSATFLNSATFPSTGGWQNWATTTRTLQLDQGIHQLRVLITAPLFNLNWIEFDLLTSTDEAITTGNISLHPNPTQTKTYLNFEDVIHGNYELAIYNTKGQQMVKRNMNITANSSIAINLNDYTPGIYFLHIRDEKGQKSVKKLVKDK